MRFHSKRITTAVAFFLVFATSQIYVGARFAERGASAATNPQQTSGILSTQANKQITVNGASAISGATIMSGARIETPAGVGATVRLGGLGWLDISPLAILNLTFDSSGMVNVVLTQGCVVLHTKKNTAGQVATPDGVIRKTDPMKDDSVSVCSERGAVPPPNTGAGAVSTAGAAAGGGGMSSGTMALIGVAVAGGVIAAVVAGSRGSNPSPGSP